MARRAPWLVPRGEGAAYDTSLRLTGDHYSLIHCNPLDSGSVAKSGAA